MLRKIRIVAHETRPEVGLVVPSLHTKDAITGHHRGVVRLLDHQANLIRNRGAGIIDPKVVPDRILTDPDHVPKSIIDPDRGLVRTKKRDVLPMITETIATALSS